MQLVRGDELVWSFPLTSYCKCWWIIMVGSDLIGVYKLFFVISKSNYKTTQSVTNTSKQAINT